MTDAALHAALAEAAARGRIAVEVNYEAANRNGAPGYRTTDLVVPWFVGAAVSIYLATAYGVAVGVALFIVAAGVILVALRPYNRKRAIERYRATGLASLDHWEKLWALGGLTLRRLDRDETVASPDGDWRGVARALGDGAAGRGAA